MKILTSLVLLLFAFARASAADGSLASPLRVMLIPADGGTASGTLADFQPLFSAVTRSSGLHFDLRVGESYAAVVQALQSRMIDVAWLGPVAYVQAHAAGSAELLAVAQINGGSVYYAGIFVRSDAPVRTLSDLEGRRLALGDVNSGSSFTYPVDMLLKAGIDPARDLAEIRLMGSHAASLAALAAGHVDAAGLSFESFARAANSGTIDAREFRVLARSEPIPNAPLALATVLAAPLKAKLREAFGSVHDSPGVAPDMIRGYGGQRVDRYDTGIDDDAFASAGAVYARVDDGVRAAVLRKAGQR